MKKLTGLICAAGLVFTVACGQTDAGITTSVNTQLATDDMVSALDVNVTTDNGVVTLSGTVESVAERERAMEIARNTEGVRDVIDQLRIGEAAPTTGVEIDDDFGREHGDVEIEREDRPALPGDDRDIVR
jgi:hypothetical protein